MHHQQIEALERHHLGGDGERRAGAAGDERVDPIGVDLGLLSRVRANESPVVIRTNDDGPAWAVCEARRSLDKFGVVGASLEFCDERFAFLRSSPRVLTEPWTQCTQNFCALEYLHQNAHKYA